MEKNEEVARLLEVARDFQFAMLTTIASDQHLHARPMTIAELDEEDLLRELNMDAEAVARLRERVQKLEVPGDAK